MHVEIYKEWNNARILDDIDYRFMWGALTLFMLVSVLGFWRQRIIGKFNSQLMVKNEQLESLEKRTSEKESILSIFVNSGSLERYV